MGHSASATRTGEDCLGICCLLWNADVEVGIPDAPPHTHAQLPWAASCAQMWGRTFTLPDHASVPSRLTVSEAEYEADSAGDGATDNESDTDSDYDSLPSLLTESETDGLLQRESVHSHAVLWLP